MCSHCSLRHSTKKDLPVQTKSCFPVAPSWVFCAVCCLLLLLLQRLRGAEQGITSKEIQKSLNTHISTSELRAWSNLLEWNTSLHMARDGRR